MKFARPLFILVCLLPITVFASNLPLPVDSSTRFGCLDFDESNYEILNGPETNGSMTSMELMWYSDTVPVYEGHVFRVLNNDADRWLQFKNQKATGSTTPNKED